MGVSVEHAARRLQSLQKENGSIIVEEHKGIRARDAGKEGPHPLTEFGHRRAAVVALGEANRPMGADVAELVRPEARGDWVGRMPPLLQLSKFFGAASVVDLRHCQLRLCLNSSLLRPPRSVSKFEDEEWVEGRAVGPMSALQDQRSECDESRASRPSA